MDPFLGEIKLFPYNYAPKGWVYCDGQVLPVAKYQALFSLLGAFYGGDGRETFALPNLKGKEPHPNMHYCIAMEGIYPPRG